MDIIIFEKVSRNKLVLFLKEMSDQYKSKGFWGLGCAWGKSEGRAGTKQNG